MTHGQTGGANAASPSTETQSHEEASGPIWRTDGENEDGREADHSEHSQEAEEQRASCFVRNEYMAEEATRRALAEQEGRDDE